MPILCNFWKFWFLFRVLTNRLLEGRIVHNIALFSTKVYTIWSLPVCTMGTQKCVYRPLQDPPHSPVSCSYYWEKGKSSLKKHYFQKITCLAKSSQEIFEKYPYLMGNVAKNNVVVSLSLSPQNSPLLGVQQPGALFILITFTTKIWRKKINNYDTLRIKIK